MAISAKFVPVERTAVGIDAGGTKIAAGLVDRRGRLLDSVVLPTPRDDAGACLDSLVDAARAVVERADDLSEGVAAIGVGLPGLVDPQGIFRYGPNFPLRNVDVGEAFAPLGLPLWFGNDANVAAWAEYLFGAGERCGDLLMLTLGTGIGGGIISGGRPFRGAHGFAGEIGHLVFAGDGAPHGDGTDRHWERYASGSALDGLAAAAAREGAAAILAEAGGDLENVQGRHVAAAAAAGDPAAVEVMDTYASRVAVGIAGLVQCLDPARVVVGGGVCAAGEVLFEPLRRHTRRLLTGAAHRPEVPVVAAELGPHAGMVGAASLALEL